MISAFGVDHGDYVEKGLGSALGQAGKKLGLLRSGETDGQVLRQTGPGLRDVTTARYKGTKLRTDVTRVRGTAHDGSEVRFDYLPDKSRQTFSSWRFNRKKEKNAGLRPHSWKIGRGQ